MRHILSEVFPFLAAVFEHWQIWSSGSGIGGLIVITVGVVEKLFNKSLTKKQYVYLFLVSFFLCSCFLAWVDRDDSLQQALHDKNQQRQDDIGVLRDTQNQLGSLTYQCQYQSGVTDTLRKQSGDQQNIIDGCLSQAIKLLQPTPFSYDAMAFESIPENGNKKSTWLIVTNKAQTPVSFTVTCTSEILSMDVGIVQQQSLGKAERYTDMEWLFQISSPAWTPHAPIFVRTVTKGDGVLSCEFGAKGTTLK